jgi:hypothetical protein
MENRGGQRKDSPVSIPARLLFWAVKQARPIDLLRGR